MRKDTLLLILGGLIFISPLIAVPRSFKDPAIFVLGALILLVALLYRLEMRRRERHREAVAHAENDPNTLERNVPHSAM